MVRLNNKLHSMLIALQKQDRLNDIINYQCYFEPLAAAKGWIRWVSSAVGYMNCYACKFCDAEPKTAWAGVLRHFKKHHPEKLEELLAEILEQYREEV